MIFYVFSKYSDKYVIVNFWWKNSLVLTNVYKKIQKIQKNGRPLTVGAPYKDM